MEVSDKILTFTTRVLGSLASKRLRVRSVHQTIRNVFSTPIRMGWKVGDTAGVVLEDTGQERIGQITILAIEPILWSDITADDARFGGFDTVDQLGKALKRAGYRFKDPSSYYFYRIRFLWVEG